MTSPLWEAVIEVAGEVESVVNRFGAEDRRCRIRDELDLILLRFDCCRADDLPARAVAALLKAWLSALDEGTSGKSSGHTTMRRRLPHWRMKSRPVRSTPRGSLERHLPQSAATEEELYLMRRAAWRGQGVAILRTTDIRDDWVRQTVVNEANRLYGVRDTV